MLIDGARVIRRPRRYEDPTNPVLPPVLMQPGLAPVDRAPVESGELPGF